MKTVRELMRLDGRVALITGGAGHIGTAMAEALAELGCHLCLVDVDERRLDEVRAGVVAACPVRVQSVVCDLEDEAARASLPALVRSEFGRLDVLVNNAAFVGSRQLEGWATSFENQSLATWRQAFEVNLTTAFHLSQVFAPLLRERGGGSIVNVGSIYALVGPDLALYEGTAMGSPAAYAASKGGLLQLTRWLSTVLAPDVRVNSISPGGVARGQPESFVTRYVARTPLRRMATEEDFKGAIAYLASDLSAYVTGENIVVDGGWTAW
jgi:NAD(P)-dependent dehydrogenase (short-subunit alcohol dehydrogenase family)